MSEVADVIGKAPLLIDDTQALTTMGQRASYRRLKAEHKISLVVGYLQLMCSSRIIAHGIIPRPSRKSPGGT